MAKNLAKYIDQTVLKATATQEDIDKLIMEARFNDFASICVIAL